MEDGIKERIRVYCEKGNMKMAQCTINLAEEGYVATDGYTSIMFDNEGKVSSLPMHELYGNRATQLIGKGYAIYTYIIIAIVVVAIIIQMLINNI